jgi:hypothetical protein
MSYSQYTEWLSVERQSVERDKKKVKIDLTRDWLGELDHRNQLRSCASSNQAG